MAWCRAPNHYLSQWWLVSRCIYASLGLNELTHGGRVTHICVSDLTIIGSDNGLSPGRRQAIIWTNAGLLSIEPLRTDFSENLIKIQPFSLKKMHVKMSSAKWRPSCLGLNELIATWQQVQIDTCFKLSFDSLDGNTMRYMLIASVIGNNILFIWNQ